MSKKLLFSSLLLLIFHITYSQSSNFPKYLEEEQSGCNKNDYHGEYEWLFYPGNFKWFDNIWGYNSSVTQKWEKTGPWAEDFPILIHSTLCGKIFETFSIH